MADKLPPLVVIPAKNEESTVGMVTRDALAQSCHVVIVDDCSSDNSSAVARNAGAIVLSLTMNLGAWGAIQTGMRYALIHGYEIVVTMDGDGQHLAHYIPNLLEPVIKKKADVAIGAFPTRGSKQRKIAWRFFKSLTGLDVNDLTSGFRVYNRKAFDMLTSRNATLLDYQDVGVLLLLQKAELSMKEVPIIMHQRTSGHSRIYNSWWKVFVYLLESTVLSVSRRPPPLLRRKKSS